MSAQSYKPHSVEDYRQALAELLPPGKAWDWQPDSFGYKLLTAIAEEWARIDNELVEVLPEAIEAHQPKSAYWRLIDYRAVGCALVADVAEVLPRQMFAVGSHAGERLWSDDVANQNWEVANCRTEPIYPFTAGSHAGDRCWSNRNSRYGLRIRYYQSVVDPQVILDGIMAMKQAHVFLYFEDITGRGREQFYLN